MTDSPTHVLMPTGSAGENTNVGDGRTLRRRRNRDAVISALIELVREGDLDPTVAKIADRAEVSHRSIFRYFDDLNDLALTAIETEFHDVRAKLTIPDAGEGGLAHRIDQLVDHQLRTVQRTHALGRVARARSITIPEIDHGLQIVAEFRLDQIRRQFAPEFAAMGDDRSEALAITMLVLLGFDGYDIPRRALGHPVEEIRKIWSASLHALLD